MIKTGILEEKKMKKFKQGVYSVLGRIYIPEEIKGNKDLILHISDTPLAIYPAIRRLIRKMNPKVIIHTGDLADHIKLEYNENLMNEFLHDAKKIIRIMEFSSAEEIYLVIGNHDKYSEIKDMVTRSTLIEMNEVIKIKGFDFNLSHYYEDVITNPKDYNLYGHNPLKKNHKVRTRWYLNGVSSINVIEASTGKVHELRYPWGTDSYRYRRRKSGL